MNAVREIWRPETRADSEAVLRELKEVLGSPQFCNSKRYPALLRYVVEQTLAGRADLLKERTLGVEVFGRPATYDTSLDTVVRYTAGEIRKRLSLYYHEEGRNARIQIHLPAGSYVPEFVSVAEEPQAPEPVTLPPVPEAPAGIFDASVQPAVVRQVPETAAKAEWKPGVWLGVLLGVLLTLTCVGVAWKLNHARTMTAVDEFWSPFAREQGQTLVCLGGSVFQQNNYSGVVTASKNIDYPFVSMQIAASLPRVSQILDREAVTYEVQSSASTAITQMRNRPVILLGGYNNGWTMRMLHALRYQFSSEPVESIFDTQSPQTRWSRDRSLPYANADDYALVARFRDASTDGLVVALAGLGRNGSEAAAQFATSPYYMGLLREKLGSDLDRKNIEVVLKVNVIDGKTGAPSIEAVHTW